ncbi:centlein-like [Physella acuta]|uniref:centlein-like n=1 Tax=Physella acuta TaxID=109671 RepID=UPI0027DCFD55|nr:centlein-like [Physella acuta]
MHNQPEARSDVNKEKHLEDTFRKTVEDAEKEKYDLGRKISRLTSELEISKSEKSHAVNRQKVLEERIRTLEKEVTDKMVKFQDLVREIEDSSARLAHYESQNSQQRRDLDFKNQELENIRKELKELWMTHNQLTEHSGQQADLIRQLQSLQQDTQKMMKNQEDAFTLESTSLQQMFTDVNARYEQAKRTEADLRQQVLELKKSLMDKDDVISTLNSQELTSRQAENRNSSTRQPEYGGSFLDIVQEVDAINGAATPRSRTRGRSLNRSQDLEGKVPGSHCVLRPRSLSPPTQDVEPRLELFDVRKVEQLQKELSLKTRQLEEIRKAHDNRIKRYENLQASYRLAREEMKALEFGSKPKAKKIKRADPRSLQKENSDAVWNELTYFKNENRSLQVDKLSLQEEVDLLRVQTAQDDATIHELKVALQGQKEDFEFQLRRQTRENRNLLETEKQVSLLKSQVQNKSVLVEKLERDLLNSVAQRDDLVQEKSKLMSQLVNVQQDASTYRMELADVKHKLQSANRKLEELEQEMAASHTMKRSTLDEDSSALASSVVASLAVKRKSREASPTKYKNDGVTPLYNDEEWEEVESESEQETGSADLNQTLRFSARKSKKPAQVGDDQKKKNKSHRVPTHRPPAQCSDQSTSPERLTTHRSRSTSRVTEGHVGRREFATSPISFLSPTLRPSRTQAANPQHPPTLHHASYAVAANRRAKRAVESRQMATLKQRITHLVTQVTVLKNAKMLAVQAEETLQETVSRLQSDLVSMSGRLKASKQLAQKLQTDLEKLQKEKQAVEEQLTAEKKDTKSDNDGHEMKVLEAKLKVAASEASRQSSAMKTLKTDNDSLQDQIRTLQEKVNHLERDNNQKRVLLESQKVKLKHVQEVSKSEADNVEELETKIKLLTDTNNKNKVQIESLRKRLGLVTKEKKTLEEKLHKTSRELDLKSKQLTEATNRCAALETALSDLESSAQQQLHGLASQSESAIDAAREKLAAAQSRILQFQTTIKILATEILGRTEQARSQLTESLLAHERSKREEDLSLQRAQDKAKDILNLSQSDLEDIMSADGDMESLKSLTVDGKKMDKRWLRKCEKILNSGDDFVRPLVKLLLQKFDERTDLIMNTPR